MGYKVEVNRLNKTARLVYFATVRRGNIGKPGEERRRITLSEVTRPGMSGVWDYHVTKGGRRKRVAA